MLWRYENIIKEKKLCRYYPGLVCSVPRTAYSCFRITARIGCEHVHNHSLYVSWGSVSSHRSSAHSNLFVFRYLKTIIQASENIAVLQRQNASCVTCWLTANLTHHLAVGQAQVPLSLQVSSPGIFNNSYRQELHPRDAWGKSYSLFRKENEI